LAPPVSDDDGVLVEEEGSGEVGPTASSAVQTAYIHAMVPNPIPTDENHLSGLDMSTAAAAAFDEELGFPSLALMTGDHTSLEAGVEDIASLSTFGVRAPVKRVHAQMDADAASPLTSSHRPFSKLAKTEALTPATLRTSLQGVGALNPLLFGRPIKLPTDATLDSKKSKSIKVPSIPRRTRNKMSSKGRRVTKNSSSKHQAPRQVVSAKILETRKFLSPETHISYFAPPYLARKLKENSSGIASICKIMVKGKIQEKTAAVDSALAPVPAPPIKISSNSIKKLTYPSSVTASNKRSDTLGNKKKALSTSNKTCEQISPATTNTIIDTGGAKAPANVSVTASKTLSNSSLMVANPLANVASTSVANARTALPPKLKTTSVSAPLHIAPSESNPAVVSSNSSTASITSEDQIMCDISDPPEDQKTTKAPSRSLTTEEKAQACRDRNRQHARNTRLRKKAYVEELKQSLNNLVEERDREEVARKELDSKKEEQRQARKKVLQDFLRLRGENQRDRSQWEQLLHDPTSFQLILPVTKYQNMVDESLPITAYHQLLVGIHDIMADANYSASFLQSIEDAPDLVSLEVCFDRSCFIADGDAGFLTWKATSRGLASMVSVTVNFFETT